MIGQCFGLLTVTGPGPKAKCGQKRWACRCDCGAAVVKWQSNLRSGQSHCCGCTRGARISVALTKRIKHGHRRTRQSSPEYESWHAAKGRTSCSDNKSFADYGGRGIRMAKEFSDSFEAFLAEVGPRPSPAHSLDRKDTNGHYERGNMRWATPKQQSRNKRNIKLLAESAAEIRAMRGRVMQADLAVKFGVSVSLISLVQLNRIWLEDAP